MIQGGWDGQYDELTLPDHTVIVEAYLYAVLREIIQGVWSGYMNTHTDIPSRWDHDLPWIEGRDGPLLLGVG